MSVMGTPTKFVWRVGGRGKLYPFFFLHFVVVVTLQTPTLASLQKLCVGRIEPRSVEPDM